MLLGLILACHDNSDLERRVVELEKKQGLHEDRLRALERSAENKKEQQKDCEVVSKGVFRLSRAKMKAHAANKESLPRLLPYQRNGLLLGVRLADLNPTWENCGFQNGDVALEVNGSNIRSQRMLQTAYEANKENKALQIILQRKEKPFGLRIELFDP